MWHRVDGVAEGTHFETRTKKEISEIAWHKIKELPTSKEGAQGKAKAFWMVAGFIARLQKWLEKPVKPLEGDEAAVRLARPRVADAHGSVRAEEQQAAPPHARAHAQGARLRVFAQGRARRRASAPTWSCLCWAASRSTARARAPGC